MYHNREIETPRSKFFAEHGERVKDGGEILFIDGAVAEDSSLDQGVLIEPPKCPWEKAKVIARFWSIKAQQAVDRFKDFKSYLNGTGMPVPGVNTYEEKIEHLEMLRKKAQTAKRRFRAARAEIDANEPEWFRRHRKARADQDRSEQEFLSKIDSIRL